jgi:TolB-like protein/Tfp pilus assembly protein PilF
VLIGLSTVAASFFGWTAAVYFTRRHEQARPGTAGSVAVLPLKRLSSDPEDKLLEVGIADTVISKLSRIGGLTVRPTSAIRKYAAEDVQALVAARELQVQMVLEGTLQRAANKLRVTVNLLRVDDGASVWSETFDTTNTDLFAIQDEIARQLAGRLHARITSANSRRLDERDTSNLQALQAFQAALQDFDRRSFTSTGDAIPMFERAIRLDPQYARAHALLAYCFAWHALFVDPANAATWGARAEEIANAADGLNAGLPETHLARGELLWSEHRGWRIDDAIREFQSAIALDWNAGHAELGVIFSHLGLLERARHHLDRALEIDPLGVNTRSRYVEHRANLGEYEEALRENQRLFNRNGPIEALLALRRVALAKPLIEDALRTSSAPRVLANQALLFAIEGRFADAARLIPRIEQGRLDRGYHHAAVSVAGAFALQDKAADALKWLRICASKGMPNYLLFSRDPSLAPIRNHPEFRRFMADIERTWERYRQRYA